MDFLNQKVNDKYCEICGCSIRNRTKHISSKKHEKNIKDTQEVLSDGLLIKQLFTNFDVNNTEQVGGMIDILSKKIKSLQ